MKTFLFESICLISSKEKKAREIIFHPKKNLVVGRNHTGKSSLIKNLFLTLGAKPQGVLDKWSSDTISVVYFAINDVKYHVLHHNGKRALFNTNNVLIAAMDTHREWAELFAEITGFNLILTDKFSKSVTADPKCFFLLFYINQDGSWGPGWDTFPGMQQYKSPVSSILDYFTGIKPPRYYEINSEKSQLQQKLEDFQREKVFLGKARNRFDKSFSITGPKLQPGNFELEIEQLTGEVNELNNKQEVLRESVVKGGELVHTIQLQIELANSTLANYDKDITYIVTNDERLECPTCGTRHTHSFLDALVYADDARSLRELVVQLHSDAEVAAQQYLNSKNELNELDAQYERINSILNTREGDLKFEDVVASMGAEKAFKAFSDEAAAIEQNIGEHALSIQALAQELKKLIDRKRSGEIINNFRETYRVSLSGLNMPILDTSKFKLSSRPAISGSGGPRSLLAYYSAVWSACFSRIATFSVPIVIDSPNQQGQDDINLPTILRFIAKGLPQSSQIILCSEIDVQQSFDNVMLLDKPYSLLLEEEYEFVKSFVNPLFDKMLIELQNKSLTN